MFELIFQIFLFVAAAFFGMGCIGAKDILDKRNFTWAFIACIAAITATIIF